MRFVSINVGFVTSSSSVIHYFDKRLLEDPEVKAFLERYELQEGKMGRDIMRRSSCSSLLITGEQKREAWSYLCGEKYPWDKEFMPTYDAPGENEFVVMYGDEYESFANILCTMLKRVQEKLGLTNRSADYH